MRQLKITSIIQLAFDRTQDLVLRPFNPRRWIKLFWIALLSGSMYWGLNLPLDKIPHDKIPFDKINFFTNSNILFFGLAAVLGVGLSLLFIWLASRFTYVLYHALVSGNDTISESFKQYQVPANSYFLFNLRVFLCIAGAVVGIIILVLMNLDPITNQLPRPSGPLLVSIIAGLIFAFIMFIAGGLALAFINNFVVYIMAIEQCAFSQGWKKFCGLYSQQTRDMWIFMLTLIPINIILGIASATLIVTGLIVLLLAGAVIFLPLYLLATLLLKITFLGYAIIGIGIIYLIACIFFLAVLTLPLTIFRKLYTLYYISSLNCGWAPLPIGQQPGEPS